MKEKKIYRNCTGDVLAELLKDRKLSPSQAAREAGISVQLISTWLKGQTPRGDWQIEALARVLKVDVAFILYGIQESTRFN